MKRSSSTAHTRTSSTAAEVVRRTLERWLARAADTDVSQANLTRLEARVLRTTEKYLLNFQPEATPNEIAAFVERLRLDELRLVMRCEGGDEEAWADLVAQFGSTVRAAAGAACSGGSAEAEELASSVWAELYGLRRGEDGSAGGSGKFAYYSGCGSLAGWLRAVVAQLAVDRHRKERRFVQCEETDDLERIEHRRRDSATDSAGARQTFGVQAALTPEEALAEREASNLLADALRRALAALAPEDRLLLKLYYTDEMRLREAGAVLGFSEATASRRLAALHKRIRDSVTETLVNQHRLAPDGIAALFAEAAEGADRTDVRTLLQIDDASG